VPQNAHTTRGNENKDKIIFLSEKPKQKKQVYRIFSTKKRKALIGFPFFSLFL